MIPLLSFYYYFYISTCKTELLFSPFIFYFLLFLYIYIKIYTYFLHTPFLLVFEPFFLFLYIYIYIHFKFNLNIYTILYYSMCALLSSNLFFLLLFLMQ
ncbi:hypothetical protein F4703DRAFT_1894066 [Phycomyces blakesleeanus]